MITASGYSKDQSLIPEGVVITFGKEMMENNGGSKELLKYFLSIMANEEATMNRLWGRVKFGWYESGKTFKYSPGDSGEILWPRMVLVGPFEKCPFKRELKGFQGFRYCTKLF